MVSIEIIKSIDWIDKSSSRRMAPVRKGQLATERKIQACQA
jgi:hypothetical protein